MADEPANYVFSESDVIPGRSLIDTEIQTNRSTPEEIIAIANQIWKKVQSTEASEAASDKLLEEIQEEFKDFNTSFPLVVRWMVQLRKYRVKAFKKYLINHVAKADLSTKEKFLELQAEYPVLVAKEENPRRDSNFIREYRASIVKQLLEEDKLFMEMQKKVEEDFEKDAEKYDQERRQKLYSYLLSKRVQSEAAEQSK
jgi:hypothetical protein